MYVICSLEGKGPTFDAYVTYIRTQVRKCYFVEIKDSLLRVEKYFSETESANHNYRRPAPNGEDEINSYIENEASSSGVNKTFLHIGSKTGKCGRDHSWRFYLM